MCHSILVEVGEVSSMGTPEGVLHSWRDKPVTVSRMSPYVSKLGYNGGGHGAGWLIAGRTEGLGKTINSVLDKILFDKIFYHTKAYMILFILLGLL